MNLTAGTKLGPYEVVGPLGAGKEIGQCLICLNE
jgi:hypothetical protein